MSDEPNMGTWIRTALAVTRAMSRNGWGIPFLVRGGLMTVVGRMRPGAALAANNDDGRYKA